ncbi:hypothetical protein [Vulcanisaeta sp. JCM 14467]
MLRLILGRTDYVGINAGLTFKLIEGVKQLDGVPNVRLGPLGRALVNRVFRELGLDCDATHAVDLRGVIEECSYLPSSVRFMDNFNAGELSKSLNSIPLPTIEPTSTLIGLALASTLRVNTEFYSDLWPRLTDALAQLKALGVDIAVHSSVFDTNRVFVFDEVVRRFISYPRVDGIAESNFNKRIEVINNSNRRLIEERNAPIRPYALAEPREPIIDEGILTTVEALIKDLGGVATLKALSDMVGQEAVLRAIARGYLTYNPGDMTVRVTMRALSLLNTIRHGRGDGDAVEG